VVRRERNATCSDHQVAETGYSNIQEDNWTIDEGPFCVRLALERIDGSLVVLCLFTFSQKTSMSSLTWTSKFRMTRIDCSRLCTTSSSLSRIGNRSLRREFFWGSGIPGFYRLRSTVYRIVVVHI